MTYFEPTVFNSTYESMMNHAASVDSPFVRGEVKWPCVCPCTHEYKCSRYTAGTRTGLCACANTDRLHPPKMPASYCHLVMMTTAHSWAGGSSGGPLQLKWIHRIHQTQLSQLSQLSSGRQWAERRRRSGKPYIVITQAEAASSVIRVHTCHLTQQDLWQLRQWG